jgi:hypothetical protein
VSADNDSYVVRPLRVGAPLAVFRSYNHWVAKGSARHEETGHQLADLIALDTRGRVCRRPEHFQRADHDGAYPVIVYAADPGEAPGEPMVYAVSRSVAGDCWQVTSLSNLLTNPALLLDEGKPMLLVGLTVAVDFDEAKAYADELRRANDEGERE